MWDHAGTDVVGPARADRRSSRAGQLDQGGGAAFCRQPVGSDQADAARAGDRQRRTLALWRPSPTPDSTLAELQAALARRLGIVAGLSTIHNALRRFGLPLKKSR
jgi:hypothetical protein